VSYEDIVGALKDRFGDNQLVAAYRSQLKSRIEMSGETLQEFAAAVEQLSHWSLVGLSVGFIQTEATNAFIDGVRDRKAKLHLLMGGDRTLNEALNQALKLEAAKVAAGPLPRLREVTRAPSGTTTPPPQRRREGRPVCWQCGTAVHLRRDCGQRPYRGRPELGKRVSAGVKRGPPASSPLSPRFTLNVLAQGTNDSLIAEGWIQGTGS
jgi:hypothetical protein